MAATTFQPPPTNHGNYHLNPRAVPSPPETYLDNKNASTSSLPMAQQPPPWNLHFRGHPPGPVGPENYNTNVTPLQPRRQPLYLPAALRPADPTARTIPGRPRYPDTPPASQGNSYDSLNPKPHYFGEPGLPIDGHGEVYAELEREMSRIALDEGLQVNPEPVTGPPTTAHWKPDVMYKTCAICHVAFTWYFRRHHCRHCGEIVCDNHIKHKVPLDHNARFHPEGEESKACPRCHDKWMEIKKVRDSRANSIADRETDSPETDEAGVPIPKQHGHLSEEQRVGGMAQSVGGGDWSTF